jgi:hypothetical protein
VKISPAFLATRNSRPAASAGPGEGCLKRSVSDQHGVTAAKPFADRAASSSLEQAFRREAKAPLELKGCY